MIDMVTDLDSFPVCPSRSHGYAEQDEEPIPNTKVPQYGERSESCCYEKTAVKNQCGENQSKENDSKRDESENTKCENEVSEALHYPLPPTEIHDGLLFRKVG
jgi:hypothetical protein